MKKLTLSHLIGKSQHYVNIISKSRLFVDFFAMSSPRNNSYILLNKLYNAMRQGTDERHC